MLHVIQETISKRYERFRVDADIPQTLAKRLSCPLLLAISEPWLTSRYRLLLVGQETFGWAFENGDYYEWPFPPMKTFQDFRDIPEAVEALVGGYRAFDYCKYQPKDARSPFWKAYRTLRTELEQNIDGSILWTNLFRVDLDGGSVINKSTREELALLQDLQAGLLRDEIEILKPQTVLFFTGPSYNDALVRELPGVKFTNFGSKPTKVAAWLSHPGLPPLSIRTYHPAYLNRIKMLRIPDDADQCSGMMPITIPF